MPNLRSSLITHKGTKLRQVTRFVPKSEEKELEFARTQLLKYNVLPIVINETGLVALFREV